MQRRRSDVLTIIDEVQPLIDQFHALSDAHQSVFLDMVDPLPEEVKPAKKSKKKSTKSAGRSPRATSLQQQIQSTTTTRLPTDKPPTLCAYSTDGKVCHGAEGDGIHDKAMGYGGYHPFESSSAAPAAGGRSSSENGTSPATENGTRKPVSSSKSDNDGQETGAKSSAASSEVEVESVSSATGG